METKIKFNVLLLLLCWNFINQMWKKGTLPCATPCLGPSRSFLNEKIKMETKIKFNVLLLLLRWNFINEMWKKGTLPWATPALCHLVL